GTLDEVAGYLMFRPVQIAPVQMHRALAYPHSGNPSKFTWWGGMRSRQCAVVGRQWTRHHRAMAWRSQNACKVGAWQTAFCISPAELLNLFDPFDPWPQINTETVTIIYLTKIKKYIVEYY